MLQLVCSEHSEQEEWQEVRAREQDGEIYSGGAELKWAQHTESSAGRLAEGQGTEQYLTALLWLPKAGL